MNTDKHRRCSGASARRRSALRWISAPQSSLASAPSVQGVALSANEDVQWSWTHTKDGSYVSGYTIVPRLTPRPVILSKAKNLSRAKRGENCNA
jgi:hypothetical protein